MRPRTYALLALLIPVGCARPEPVDLLLRNGNVYPEPGQPTKAQAIAIRGDRIVFVGSDADAARFRAVETVDLAGATVFPGWADGHSHLEEIGNREAMFNLEGTNTKAAFLARLKARAAEAKPGEWIQGGGWVETFWTPPVYPTRWDIDSVTPNNPVFLSRFDYHAALLNSKALERLGITKATKAPAGGRFDRDARGELTGMAVDNAQDLIMPRLPRLADAELDQRLILGSSHAVEQGWTEIHETGGTWDEIVRLRRLHREGKLKIRSYRAVWGPGAAAESLLARGPVMRESGGRVTIRAIKMVMDGAMGSRGALLFEPYADDPGNRGLLTLDTVAAFGVIERALAAGLQVQIHAIGDRANALALDLYQRALGPNPTARDHRFRIEHASVVRIEDRARFKALGVMPSMQPSFLLEDLYFAPRRFGPDRMKEVYAFRSFIDLGVPVIGGSDVPASTGDPLVDFYAAVARKDLDGKAGPDSLWHPEERVTREQALQMFTTWAARGAFEEDVRGTIAAGKWADLTIVDRDIMTIPEPEILKARVVMTVIGGEVTRTLLAGTLSRR